jgi:diguanylate cyclase (GGDEF)-like protein
MAVRQEDTVARLGGDEFVIVLYDVYNGDVDPILKKILDVVSKKVRFGDKYVFCTASIGVDTMQTHGNDPAKLIDNADKAMYKAKKLGKNRHMFFDDYAELFPIEEETN